MTPSTNSKYAPLSDTAAEAGFAALLLPWASTADGAEGFFRAASRPAADWNPGVPGRGLYAAAPRVTQIFWSKPLSAAHGGAVLCVAEMHCVAKMHVWINGRPYCMK